MLKSLGKGETLISCDDFNFLATVFSVLVKIIEKYVKIKSTCL